MLEQFAIILIEWNDSNLILLFKKYRCKFFLLPWQHFPDPPAFIPPQKFLDLKVKHKTTSMELKNVKPVTQMSGYTSSYGPFTLLLHNSALHIVIDNSHICHPFLPTRIELG